MGSNYFSILQVFYGTSNHHWFLQIINAVIGLQIWSVHAQYGNISYYYPFYWYGNSSISRLGPDNGLGRCYLCCNITVILKLLCVFPFIISTWRCLLFIETYVWFMYECVAIYGWSLVGWMKICNILCVIIKFLKGIQKRTTS